MLSAQKFSDVLLSGFRNVGRFPQRYSSYLHGTQRLVLDKFPYSIVYLDWQDEVFIVAVAHAKRRPGYWKSRI
jgi:plasmid stabilization system protein ParE